MAITTAQGLIDFCLRQLGSDVINVEISEAQLTDNLEYALQAYQSYHFDGIERSYYKAQVVPSSLKLASSVAGNFQKGETVTGNTSGATAEVYDTEGDTIALKGTKGTFVNNETITGNQSAETQSLATSGAFTLGNYDQNYFQMPADVYSVIDLLPIGPYSTGGSPSNIFSAIWQYRAAAMWDLIGTNQDLVPFVLMKQNLAMLEMLFPARRSLRFNKRQQRLYIDMNWQETLKPGDYVVAEVYRILDPEEFNTIYDDNFMKRYLTALLKKQWGANTKKYANMQLPGGVRINGKEIYEEGVAEVKELERELKEELQIPTMFYVG